MSEVPGEGFFSFLSALGKIFGGSKQSDERERPPEPDEEIEIDDFGNIKNVGRRSSHGPGRS